MHGACPLATSRDARAPCPLRRAGLLRLLAATTLSAQRATPQGEPRFPVVPYARCKTMVIQALVPVCFSMSRDASIPASVVFADSANFTFHSDHRDRARVHRYTASRRGVRPRRR